LATHVLLGDLDLALAGLFAVGLVPGVIAGSRLAQIAPTGRLRLAFGLFLVLFAVWFLARQVT
jgi:uncharacterized membrane protein YfcA